MKIKKTLITKEVSNYTLNSEIVKTYLPNSGDVAVFEIVELGKHEAVQSDAIRNVAIFEGDLIMATFADRYATSQYEGYVPTKHHDLYHILGAGGAIGIVKSKNAALNHIEPTTVKLVGYCCDETGKVINTRFYNKKRIPFTGEVPGGAKIILSIGSTMDSGKTTTAAHVARGLKSTGKKVGFIKFTGTAYSKDKDYVRDCGADVALDFADMGFPSTYMCDKETLLDVFQSLLGLMDLEKPSYIVMEIADGLLQRETAFLLQDERFMSTIHNIVFSSGDSLSAIHGVEILKKYNLAPCALSGRFTMSPLLVDEAKAYLGLPVLTIDQIMTGEFNHYFLEK